MIPLTLPTTPQEIAPDSWLIPTLAAEPSGTYFGAHSLVIPGREPIVVDTGCSLVRDAWAASSVLRRRPARRALGLHLPRRPRPHRQPAVRARAVPERHARRAASRSSSRLAGDVELPLERMRWVDAGGSFDAGDRTLHAVRPPMFDSPATRGLFDATTGLLWAADSFGTFFPGDVHEADDIPADLYDVLFDLLNAWNTPWLEWVDVDRFRTHVSTTADAAAGGRGERPRPRAPRRAHRRCVPQDARPRRPPGDADAGPGRPRPPRRRPSSRQPERISARWET